MRRFCLTSILLLSPFVTAACFDSDEVIDDIDASSTATGGDFREFSYTPGGWWGPCVLGDPWGCEGEPGEGLACIRPVNDLPLGICVPQTASAWIPDDCEGMEALDPGFGQGISLDPSTVYCVGRCESDRECPSEMLCSAHGFCAWHE